MGFRRRPSRSTEVRSPPRAATRSPRSVRASTTSARLSPPWRDVRADRRQSTASASYRAAAENAGRGRQLAKGIIFSSRPIAESLFARYMTKNLADVLTLATMHVDGGLTASNQAAELARTHGVTALPSVVVWADTEDEPPWGAPESLRSLSGLARDRHKLIDDPRSAPSVPQLRASATTRCVGRRTADRRRRALCALLVVPTGQRSAGPWPAEAVATLGAMRRRPRNPDRRALRLARWPTARGLRPYVLAAPACVAAAAAVKRAAMVRRRARRV